jgi:DNA-nicking Smr family endonuclease
MAELVDIVMAKLREARLNGRAHAMIIHGKSTSRRGKTTARSQVPARKSAAARSS